MKQGETGGGQVAFGVGAGAHAGSSARESAPGRARRMSVEERPYRMRR